MSDPPNVGFLVLDTLRRDRVSLYNDDMVGSFIAFLRRTDRLDDTIFIVLSDHGQTLGESELYGHQYRCGPKLTRVPLIVHTLGTPPDTVDNLVKLRGLFDLLPALAGSGPNYTPSVSVARGGYSSSTLPSNSCRPSVGASTTNSFATSSTSTSAWSGRSQRLPLRLLRCIEPRKKRRNRIKCSCACFWPTKAPNASRLTSRIPSKTPSRNLVIYSTLIDEEAVSVTDLRSQRSAKRPPIGHGGGYVSCSGAH